MHLGCCSTFGKRKNTLACGSSIFTLSESLATSLVHGPRNPARKTIRYSFNSKRKTGVSKEEPSKRVLQRRQRSVYYSKCACCPMLSKPEFLLFTLSTK
jgi:hypothetical protein